MSSLPPGGREQRKSHPSKRSALEAQIKSEGERELKENEGLSPKRARRSDPNSDRGVRCSPGAEGDSAPPTPPKNEMPPTPSTQPPTNAACSTPVSHSSNGNIQHPQQAAVLTSVSFPHLLASGPLFSGPNNNGQLGGGMPTPPLPVFPFHQPLLDPAALQTFFASHGLPFPHPPPPPFGGIYPTAQASGLRPDALGPINYYLESAAAAGFHPYGHMDPGRRKNATREVTLPLKNWLNEHRKNPYPTKAEKTILAIVSKMTMTQVSTWFANARRRLKKENKMTWSPRNRTADDDEEDDEDEDTGRVREDGRDDRPSSSASALSVDDQRKVTPLLGTAVIGAPLNGLSFNARLENSFNSSGGSTSALETTPRKKGAIWSIADTLTDEGNVSADRQAGTSSSSSNSSAATGVVEKQRDRGGLQESGTSHRHNSVVDLSTRAPQPQEATRLKPSPSSESHDMGFPPRMLPIMLPPGSNQQNPANPTMAEAFAAAFTAFMNGAPPTMVPNSTPALASHSPAAMGLPAFMMPHLMAAGMIGATPQPASKISHTALAPSQNPLLAFMSQHQFGSANQNASQQQMMAMMAAAMAGQQYGAIRQPLLPHGSVMVTDPPPTSVPPSKLNGADNCSDRSVSRNGYLVEGHVVEKVSGTSSTEMIPNPASSPKVQQQATQQQQCRRRRDATKISSPVSNL